MAETGAIVASDEYGTEDACAGSRIKSDQFYRKPVAPPFNLERWRLVLGISNKDTHISVCGEGLGSALVVRSHH